MTPLFSTRTSGLSPLTTRIRSPKSFCQRRTCVVLPTPEGTGGGHVDYGFLRYADEFWGSDDSDARERVFIQWGESQFY
ncbi:MAG: alpha-galactosidase, partial [Oscillibacter sp.]|nr:alpha-galactosidase [Oscillibacter sp.]